MKLTLSLGDAVQELRVQRSGEELTLTFADGRELRARVLSLGEGRLLLEHGGRRLELAGASLDGQKQLWLNGRTLKYGVTLPGTRAERNSEPAPMASSIPAVVREVLVAPGDAVTSGQRLLLLESMKMVLPVVATRAGRVRAILCAPGDAVAPGVALVELDDE
jgi:acetyl/propionyl-CoA carboxylase alpha subunit